LPDADEKLRTH